MANRKRNIQMKFWVTEAEKLLIDEKMTQLPTKRYGAYLRKMAIDGYIIQVDTTDIKETTKALGSMEHQPDGQAVERRRPCLPGRHGGDPGEDGADMAVTKTHPIITARPPMRERIWAASFAPPTDEKTGDFPPVFKQFWVPPAGHKKTPQVCVTYGVAPADGRSVFSCMVKGSRPRLTGSVPISRHFVVFQRVKAHSTVVKS